MYATVYMAVYVVWAYIGQYVWCACIRASIYGVCVCTTSCIVYMVYYIHGVVHAVEYVL
jgi:hypothetical protein